MTLQDGTRKLIEELHDMGIATVGVLRCLPESTVHFEAMDDHTRDVIEWCYQQMCHMCADGHAAFLEDGNWCHSTTEEDVSVLCFAAAIRAAKEKP